MSAGVPLYHWFADHPVRSLVVLALAYVIVGARFLPLIVKRWLLHRRRMEEALYAAAMQCKRALDEAEHARGWR